MAPSDLFQKPGAFGCITDVPNVGSGCHAGRDAVAVLNRAADGTVTQDAGAAGCISELGPGA